MHVAERLRHADNLDHGCLVTVSGDDTSGLGSVISTRLESTGTTCEMASISPNATVPWNSLSEGVASPSARSESRIDTCHPTSNHRSPLSNTYSAKVPLAVQSPAPKHRPTTRAISSTNAR